MKRLNLKTTAEASRKDSYTMNPKDIIIDWSKNPREDYGTEEYEQLKALIRKEKEIHHPVFITPCPDNPGRWALRHGFRRLRIITELREEGIIIEQIPVKQIYSEEEALLLHITLNNSTKALTDVELAKTIREYSKLTQNDSPKFLSEKTGISYAKVRLLLGFDEMASTVIKEAVKNKEVSFSTAAQIVTHTATIIEQNEVLSQVKEKARNEGKKRATGNMVSAATGKTKVNKDLSRLRSILCMNGNYSEVVRLIDNMGIESDASLLSILKQQEVEA